MREVGHRSARPGPVLTDLVIPLLPRCAFPPPGTPLACAVSGGADSLALLVLAVAAGCDATAYHVDHGLRAGSAAEAEVVADAAVRLRVDFVALAVDCPPGPNLEARARHARAGALPPGAATGHTADDQAETVFVNLLRGSGADGLSAMRPGPSHPILGLRRSETVHLVASLGLQVVSDPSNNDPAYQRNRIRHELLPLAGEIARRDLVPLLSRQAGLLADEVDLLDQLAGRLDPTDARALADAPVVLARRAVRRWLAGLDGRGYPPDAAAVERVIAVAGGAVVACEVAGGLRVRRSKGRLLAEPARSDAS
ncbi:MAG: tilS [Acidimicrobiaceae bacterium]|nr:tilS [Acidimicrobiaceae bacterium]